MGRVKISTGPGGITRHLTMWIVFVFVLTWEGEYVTRVGMAWLGRVREGGLRCRRAVEGSRSVSERVLGC